MEVEAEDNQKKFQAQQVHQDPHSQEAWSRHQQAYRLAQENEQAQESEPEDLIIWRRRRTNIHFYGRWSRYRSFAH